MKNSTKLSDADCRSLIDAANVAKQNAYAPYSGFRVGSALLAEDGTVFLGCNVENSSYSLTICAERNAIFQAVGQGHKVFKAMAIVSDDKDLLPPCGACRQVLSEFAPNLELVLTTVDGKKRITTLSKLFPMPADLKKLAKKSRKK